MNHLSKEQAVNLDGRLKSLANELHRQLKELEAEFKVQQMILRQIVLNIIPEEVQQ